MTLAPSSKKPRKEATIHWNVKMTERGPTVHFVIVGAHIFQSEPEARGWAQQAAYSLRDTAVRLEQDAQPTPEEIALLPALKQFVLDLDNDREFNASHEMTDRQIGLWDEIMALDLRDETEGEEGTP